MGRQQLPQGASALADETKVFLSYSRKDSEFVRDISDALQGQDDLHVFQDTSDVLPAEEWWERLVGLIGQSDTIVFCMSPNSLTSKVCDDELELAENLNKRIIPLVLEWPEGEVPARLAKLNCIHFTNREEFGRSIEQLVCALRTDIAWIREHTRIGELARRWQRRQRRAQLIRGEELSDAEQWAKYRPGTAPQLSEEMWAFIAASRTEVRRSKARSVVLASLVLAGIVVTGLLAWQGKLERAYLEENVVGPIRLRPVFWNVTPTALVSAEEGALKVGDRFRECASCPEMVMVTAGKFLMGSPDARGELNEHPQREINISQPFAVSRFEITFDQWEACVAHGGCAHKANDQYFFGRSSHPVINVSWNDITQDYIPWLSQITGKTYRLLTEAEWEFAARANTTTNYSWGDGPGKGKANCDGCGSRWDDKQTAPVGSFQENQFGLHDMHGNVWEWVQDCYANSYRGAPTNGSARQNEGCNVRVVRGGSWFKPPSSMRAANRNGYKPNERFYTIGFRVARVLRPGARAVAQEEDYAKSFKLWLPMAERGDARAQYNIGWLYRRGYGVARDYAKAKEWYSKSARQGNKYAQVALGFLYENGSGVEKNNEEAAKLFMKAAENGYAFAEQQVARHYWQGLGLLKSKKEAAKWYLRAAKRGDVESQEMIGGFYAVGWGGKADPAKARKWYIKAAENGSSSAAFLAARYLENGEGGPPDKKRALAFYRNVTTGNFVDEARTAAKRLEALIH